MREERERVRRQNTSLHGNVVGLEAKVRRLEVVAKDLANMRWILQNEKGWRSTSAGRGHRSLGIRRSGERRLPTGTKWTTHVPDCHGCNGIYASRARELGAAEFGGGGRSAAGTTLRRLMRRPTQGLIKSGRRCRVRL